MVTLDGIKKILAKWGIPSLGTEHYYACPSEQFVTFDDLEWRRTLRIFSSLDGDPLFRCWNCGTCLDALELYVRMLKKPLAEVATIMFNEGMVTQPYTEAELERYEWVSRLMRSMWKGQQRYEHGVANGIITPMFGEWLSFNASTDPVPLPPDLKPTRKINGEYFPRLLRDVFGRIVKDELWSEHLLPRGSFSYWEAPITLAMPPLAEISREEFCSPDLPDCIDAVVGRILHGT